MYVLQLRELAFTVDLESDECSGSWRGHFSTFLTFVVILKWQSFHLSQGMLEPSHQHATLITNLDYFFRNIRMVHSSPLALHPAAQ